MTNIIIASHGNYASGILDTLKHFSGDLQDVYAVCLEDKSIYAFQEECQKILSDCQTDTVILIDLYQGTPFKTFFSLSQGSKDVQIISNISFVHALTAVLNKEQGLETVVSEIMNTGNTELTDVSNIQIELSAEDE